MGVLLAIESATPAENVAIMRSIVEILKRVSQVEHIEKKKKANVSKIQALLNR